MSSGLFAGRLGLAASRIPQADRHGLLWVAKGNLTVEDGTLHFRTAGGGDLAAGEYAIPYQSVSMILLGPGTTVSHDALRILARHGTLLAAVGEGGVKFYTAPPMGKGRSAIARTHANRWANPDTRLEVARRMYRLRFNFDPPHAEISVLRGLEGARLKETYRLVANQFGISWQARRYNRDRPTAADVPNQAINHAATFVEAAADIAVAAIGALPPLGFIHEDSSNAFTLDIADLWRATITLPLAFGVARRVLDDPSIQLERAVRREAAVVFRKEQLIPRMIDQIRELLGVDDGCRDP